MDQRSGELSKNSFNRFEVGGRELTCGSLIHIYHKESGYWLVGHVEHSRSMGYYFFSEYPDIPSFSLEGGMLARQGFPNDHMASWMVELFMEGIRLTIDEGLRDRIKYPDIYKERMGQAHSRFNSLLSEIENLPYFNGDKEET